MARIKLSGVQIPTLSKLNIDGEFTLDAASGTTGQVLISQGAGNTPIWTSSLTSLTGLTVAGTTSLTGATTISAASTSSGNGTSHSITAGSTSAASATGGSINITGGAASNSGSLTNGGAINIVAGAGNSTQGAGGLVYIDGGLGSVGNGNGSVQIGTGSGSDSVTIGKSSGTITLSGTATFGIVPNMPSQTKNYFLASPTGANGVPTFRAFSYLDIFPGTPPTTYGQAITYAPVGNGMAWTGPYVPVSGGSFSAGTGTVYPVKFTSGTNLTTPTAGALEYDGVTLYATPAVSTATSGSTVTGRGRIPAVQTFYVNADSTIATASTSTASGNILNGKSFWLAANTVYEVEYYLHTKLVVGSGGASATNHILGTTFPTSATGLLNIEYQTGLSTQTIQSTVIAWQSNTGSTTNTIDTSKAISTTTYYRYRIKGTVKTGATAGYLLVTNGITTASGTTATLTTMAGSYAKSTVIGAAGADINIGPLT